MRINTVDSSPDPALDIAWALGTMTLGGFYSSVAVFSLERRASAADDEAPVKRVAWPMLSVVPTAVGDGVLVTATF